MSVTTLNKRLDRLHAPGDWRNGIADRLSQALAEQEMKHEEYRRLGLTKAEIEAKEAAELRERLARMNPVTPIEKRIYEALAALAGKNAGSSD